MRPLTRYHLACLIAVLAALFGLANATQVNAADDLALEAKLESSRWEGLSVRYPPSVLHIVRSPADPSAAVGANVDRLGVRSRDEMVRVDLERGGIVLPGVADGLERCPPS
jgi:hypothetical protein